MRVERTSRFLLRPFTLLTACSSQPWLRSPCSFLHRHTFLLIIAVCYSVFAASHIFCFTCAVTSSVSHPKHPANFSARHTACSASSYHTHIYTSSQADSSSPSSPPSPPSRPAQPYEKMKLLQLLVASVCAVSALSVPRDLSAVALRAADDGITNLEARAASLFDSKALEKRKGGGGRSGGSSSSSSSSSGG